jgi:hypothetical protein
VGWIKKRSGILALNANQQPLQFIGISEVMLLQTASVNQKLPKWGAHMFYPAVYTVDSFIR